MLPLIHFSTFPRLRSSILFCVILLVLSLIIILSSQEGGATTDRGPISIIGDDAFNSTNGVTSGSGTDADPYIISGWNFNCTHSKGIYIENTKKPFVIRDCTFFVIGYSSAQKSVDLFNASNGKVYNLTTNTSRHGVWVVSVFWCDNVTLESATGPWGRRGVWVWGSTNVTISRFRMDSISTYISSNIVVQDCIFNGSHDAIAVDRSDHITVMNCTGIGTRGLSVYGGASTTYNCTFTNNTLEGIRHGDIRVTYVTKSNLFRNNSMFGYGLEVGLWGDYGWQIDMDTSNTVNGEPFRLYVNSTGTLKDLRAGQVYLVNPKDLRISNLTIVAGAPAIYLLDGVNVTLTDLNISSAGVGINSTSTDGLTIRNAGILTGQYRYYQFIPRDVIYLKDTHNVSVTNCTAKGNLYSIVYYDRTDSPSKLSFVNLTIHHASRGIWLREGSMTDLVLDGCNFTDMVYFGLYVAESRSVTVLNTTFTNVSWPGTKYRDIDVYTQGRLEFGKCTFDKGSHCIFSDTFSEARIHNSTFGEYRYNYVYLIGDNVSLENNTIDGYVDRFDYLQYCFYLLGDNITCSDNTLEGIFKAIVIVGNDIRLVRCDVRAYWTYQGDHDGICIDINDDKASYQNVSILDCYLHDTYYGLRVYNVNGGVINNTTVKECTWGVDLYDCYNFTITYGDFEDSVYAALQLSRGTDHVVHHNNFIMNNYDKRNSRYRGRQVSGGTGNNSWDNGSAGNYWDDYTQHYPNAGNDGTFWTTPFVIDTLGNNTDRYPFVRELDYVRPIADAGPNQTVGQGITIELNATASWDNLGINKFEWNISEHGTHHLVYGETASFVFEDVGVYEVVLTVFDYSDNRDTDTVWITVTDTEAPSVIAGYDLTVDQHERFFLSAHLSVDNVGIVEYRWNLTGDAWSWNGTGVTVNLTIDKVGKYLAELTCFDAEGNNGMDSLVITVLDITKPIARAGPDLTVGQFEDFTLDAHGSTDNVGIVTYSWTVDPDGIDKSYRGPRVTINISRIGTFIIYLFVGDDAGNWAVDELNVTVFDNVPPDADAGPDISVAQGETATLEGGRSTDNHGISTWSWSFEYDGEQIDLTGSNTTFTFLLAGSYTVTLTVTDHIGLVDTDTLVVEVRDTEPPIAVAGPDQEVDMGEELVLDGSASTDNVGIASYLWTVDAFGSDWNKTGDATLFSISDAGIYLVTLTVTDTSGNLATDTVQITVQDIEPPRIAALFPERVDPGSLVEFDATMSTDNVGVVMAEWRFEYDGLEVVLKGLTPKFTFDIQGEYSIHATVFDERGNEDSHERVLSVKDVEPPRAVAGGDIVKLVGDTYNLDATASDDNIGIVRYVWTFQEGFGPQEIEGPDPIVEFTTVGHFYIRLTVWDLAGNNDTDALAVTIRPLRATVHGGPFKDKNGEPISGVKVELELNGTLHQAVSDEDGNWNLEIPWDDLPGTASVHAEMKGYKPLDFKVSLDENGTIDGDVPPMVKKETKESPAAGAWMWVVAMMTAALVAIHRRSRG